MNLALPALVLFLVTLPGFIFYFVYIGRLRRSTQAVVSTGQLSIALISAVIVSAVFHAIWAFLSAACCATVDVASVLALLGGPRGNDTPASGIIASIASYPYHIFAYFMTIYIFSGTAGLGARRLVRYFQLDHKFTSLRFSNEWHYIFSGEAAERRHGNRIRKADTVLLSIAADCHDGTYLYVGFLRAYELDNDGDLRWLMLESPVFRRRLRHDLGQSITPSDIPADPDEPDETGDSSGGGPRLDDRYYEIAGDRFIAWSRDVRSLNVDYLFVDEGDIPVDEAA